MTNLSNYPLEDWFKTNLSQAWDGATGTIYMNSAPSFTFPSGVTTYLVVNPWKSNMQIAEINSINTSDNTAVVSNITLEKWAWVNSTTQSHPVNSEVIISDNYQFWKDIFDAINSKLDNDIDWSWGAATDFAWAVMKSLTTAQRTALTWVNGMVVYDTTLWELYQYIGGAWSAVSAGSTQPNASETVAGKLELATDAEVLAGTDIGWTGASLSVLPSQLNPNLYTDKTSATGADKIGISDSADSNALKSIDIDDIREAIPASNTEKGTVELATDAEATTGTDETRYINSKQAKDNYGAWLTMTTASQTTWVNTTTYSTSIVSVWAWFACNTIRWVLWNSWASATCGIQTSPDNSVWTSKVSQTFTQNNDGGHSSVSLLIPTGYYVRAFGTTNNYTSNSLAFTLNLQDNS